MGVTGLLGGTFNPPHNGHVALARDAVRHFDLERLLVTVTGQTPHKDVDVDAEIRFRLAEAAFADVPYTEVSRLDIDRPQPAYSLDTVRWARERWGDIVFIVGADRFADFLSWHQPDEVLRYARLGVATRPGVRPDSLDAVLAAVERPGQVEFFDVEPVAVSSSEVRRRVARGQTIDGLVPPPVAELIASLGLYRRDEQAVRGTPVQSS
jgi:nicotinate-nucleotide adenylyltransferase